MSTLPFLESVKQQYEDFPYPPRNPADEEKRLLNPISGNLLAINHFCFRGQKNFKSGFRCLVAGGGTGDGTIYLAEQLRDTDAEIVYLDLSAHSRKIAEERARIRGLSNITWVTASILEIPGLGLGDFDYIESAGVLHHLESTEAGLGVLTKSLKADGGMYLMLYGKYGRRAIYELQSLLRKYLPTQMDAASRIAAARQLIDALPDTNLFKRERRFWSYEIGREGHSDAGLYDLLLHSHDRCFDIPDIYRLIEPAGLKLLGFADRADAYDPLNLVSDVSARSHLTGLDTPTRQAIAELMVSDIIKHEIFLGRDVAMTATLTDESNTLRSFGTMFGNAPKIAADMIPGRVLNYKDSRRALRIPCTPIAKVVYANMDGRTSIRDLRVRIKEAVPGASDSAIEQEISLIYNSLHPRGYLYLIRQGDYGSQVPDYTRFKGPDR